MPRGSKKRAKGKQREQFDAPDVPIVFTDKRAPSSPQQTLRLLDFWRFAEEEGLVVFTEAFNRLALGGLAASNFKEQDARFWCPRIQSLASVSPDMHHIVLASMAEAILPYRLNAYVDDMVKACYRDYIEELEVEKEKKIKTLRSLLLEDEESRHAEDHPHAASTTEEPGVRAGYPSRVEEALDHPHVVSATEELGVGPSKAEDHRHTEEAVGHLGVAFATEEPGIGADHPSNAEDNVLPDQPAVAHVQAGSEDQPLGPKFVPSSQSHQETSGLLDGWKIKYHGKDIGFDDALVDLLDSSKKQNAMLVSLFFRMSSTEQKVLKQLKTLEKALSNTNERAARSSFSLFYTHLRGPCVIYPVFSAEMPYQAVKVVEDLAALCIPAEGTAATPSQVEVDTLMRIRKPSADSFLAGSSSSDSFTHLVIGETTRSLGLCGSHAKYVHPSKPERTESSKLLYKLIQLERGMIAALQLYGWNEDSLDGACLVSPSFKTLSSPELLLDTVLDHCKGALQLLYKLHQKKSVWLFDI